MSVDLYVWQDDAWFLSVDQTGPDEGAEAGEKEAAGGDGPTLAVDQDIVLVQDKVRLHREWIVKQEGKYGCNGYNIRLAGYRISCRSIQKILDIVSNDNNLFFI